MAAPGPNTRGSPIIPCPETGDFPLSLPGTACTFGGMKVRMLRAVLLGLTVLALAGCGTSTSLPQTQAGDPAQRFDFALLSDIPIPSGATMDNEKSLILGDKNRWTGRVVMKLWKSASESNQFYQAQMPAFGWEPIMAATSGVSVMAYVHGDRAATVQIESSTMWGSTVSIIVGQRLATQPGGYSAPASSGYGAPAASGYSAPASSGYTPPERVQSEPLSSRQ